MSDSSEKQIDPERSYSWIWLVGVFAILAVIGIVFS